MKTYECSFQNVYEATLCSKLVLFNYYNKLVVTIKDHLNNIFIKIK